MKRIIPFFILYLAIVFPLFSERIYYIDSRNGNDLNNGLLPASAWKTIGKINNSWAKIQPGDDILLKRGEIFTDATMYIEKGGTSSNPMIIGAYGTGRKPIIDGRPNRIPGGIHCTTPNLNNIQVQDLIIKDINGGQSLAFGADNLSHISISRVEIDGNADRNGILLSKIDTYIIEDCAVSNCGNSGIAIIGSSTYPITNGMIRNNVVHNATGILGDSKGGDGITLHREDSQGYDVGPNHQLSNNLLYNCREEGLDVTSGSHIILRKNETSNNTNGGIAIGWGVSDVWIDKHYSHNDKNVAIIIESSSRVRLTSSVIYNAWYHQVQVKDCTDFECYNNTIVCGPDSTNSLLDISTGSQNLVFKNNIFASTKANSPTRLLRYLSGTTPGNTNSSFDYNIYWIPNPEDLRMWWDGVNALTIQGWKSAWGQDSLSSYQDPQLIDPLDEDFHLRPDSASIDAGTDLELDTDFDGQKIPQGFAPDVGAYEIAKSLYARAMASPASEMAPLSFVFIATAEGDFPPFLFAWNFGDGQASTLQNPSHTYKKIGRYKATLRITDQQGSFANTSLRIKAFRTQFRAKTNRSAGPRSGGKKLPPNKK